MNDYQRIARVIQYLDEHHLDQPSLDELASVVRLSASHFHRLFRDWAGITPKDFLQCLTAEHAKQRLAASATVLDAALDSGLSGPGRLHDLTVTLEAATPGEIRRGGAGMNIRWGEVETPFGQAILGWTERGICHLEFLDQEEKGTPSSIVAEWPSANLEADRSGAEQWREEIFSGNGTSLKALVKGTDFQVKVWRALVQIPSGQLLSYSGLAGRLGSPGAARSVGSACGKNGIGFLIPCHRIIRETGIVTGYRWGDARKRAMLAWESQF